MTPANIICIKWGTKYPAYYVNRLYAGIQRHLNRPFRFFCVTDDATDIRPEVPSGRSACSSQD